MAEIDLGIVHHFIGDDLYAKQMTLPADHRAVTHKHNFSHISVLSKGTASVRVDGVQETYHAPAFVEIKAGIEHEIIAMTDTTWYCIHVTDVKDPEKVDHTLIERD